MRTKTVTLQSRMNIDYCKYNMARKYIEALPYDQWVFIKDLPEAISYEIIDLIDRHKAAYKTVFCETFEKFLVTRCITVIATLKQYRYYTDIIPVSKRELSSVFKGVSWHKYAKKYQAKMKTNNRYYHLGYFVNEKYAGIAYQIATLNLKRYYGS